MSGSLLSRDQLGGAGIGITGSTIPPVQFSSETLYFALSVATQECWVTNGSELLQAGSYQCPRLVALLWPDPVSQQDNSG